MEFKFAHSVAMFAGTVALLVAATSASAQDINFTCANGAVYLSGYSGNQCSGGSVPVNENNALLNYYAPGGIVVGDTQNVAAFRYNENQGDKTPGTAPITPPPSIPSLSGGTGAGENATESITVTDPGTAFKFDSVDLYAAAPSCTSPCALSSNTLTYTIQGYSAGGTALFGSTGITGSIKNTSSGDDVILLPDYSTIGNGGNNEYVSKLVITLTDSGGLDRLDQLVVTAPEGGAGLLYLLLGGGACFGAMFLTSRGRFTNLATV